MAARIVGAHDEAERLSSNSERGRFVFRQADHQESSARRRAHAIGLGRFGGFCEMFEGCRVGVTEGKADTPGKRSIAQPMQSDYFA